MQTDPMTQVGPLMDTPPQTISPNYNLTERIPPTWWNLVLLRWVQRQIDRLLARWRLLCLTHGRGQRWQNSCKRLMQGSAALLLASGMLLSPLIPLKNAYASGPLFIQIGGTANPFYGLEVTSGSAPVFVDIDHDGDMDAFIGDINGYIHYRMNIGTATNPSYIAQTGTANPFSGIVVGDYSKPVFVDIDHDGDMDAFVKQDDGQIHYFNNIGSATNPTFSEQSGSANPLDGVDAGTYSTLVFVDIDHDGDMDAFTGANNGTIHYYKNIGTPLVPQFSAQTGTTNPFNSLIVGNGASTPVFVDIDGDGDMDAFIGEYYGTIKYFQNVGTVLEPIFIEQSGSANPLNSVDVGDISIPAFVDIDRDGDMDVFSGAMDGHIYYYKNISNNSITPIYNAKTGTANPLNGTNVGYYSIPVLVDIDSDGDLDIFIASNTGIMYYKNTGTALAPAFVLQTGSANPLNGVLPFALPRPAFVDIDQDGDLDAFLGNSSGNFIYFKNLGNAMTPTFVEQTGASNPLDGVGVGTGSTPSFVDIDGDGDIDAFSGASDGLIRYFKNNGSAVAPSFTAQNGTNNPFNGVDVGYNSAPSFLDVDGDGDMDAFIGEFNGSLKHYKNTGTALASTFVVKTGSANPLNLVSVGINSYPTFGDIDGDGDIDAFVGAYDGNVYFYQANPLRIKTYLPTLMG
jgi:hypothetical protein